MGALCTVSWCACRCMVNFKKQMFGQAAVHQPPPHSTTPQRSRKGERFTATCLLFSLWKLVHTKKNLINTRTCFANHNLLLLRCQREQRTLPVFFSWIILRKHAFLLVLGKRYLLLSLQHILYCWDSTTTGSSIIWSGNQRSKVLV